MFNRTLLAALSAASFASTALAGTAAARMDDPSIQLLDLHPDDGLAPGYTTLPEYVLIYDPVSRSYDLSRDGGDGNYLGPYSVDARSGGAGSYGRLFSSIDNRAYLLTPWTTLRVSAPASVTIDLAAGERGEANAELYLNALNADGSTQRFVQDGIIRSFSDAASPDGPSGRTDRLLGVEISTGAAPTFVVWSSYVNAEVDATRVAPPVPEPGSWALMLAGLAGVGWAARRRRQGPAALA